MRIAFTGHVDHGKSTIIGRLLYETASLPEGKIEAIKKYCETHSRPFEYAYLLDALKDERSQGITIDTARIFFESAKRRYEIIDTPGHIEFLRNMVTGAARADAAFVVIDAQEGIRENSRRHGYLLSFLGVRTIGVLVNKMDLVDYSEERFLGIESEYRDFLATQGITPKFFIPVSGRQGDSLSETSANLPWYQGPTLLTSLDQLEAPAARDNLPLRFPIQDVYRFSKYNDPRRILAGTLASGSLKKNEDLVFYPSGKRSRVESIESGTGEKTSSGEAAGITLSEQIYVQAGEVGVRESETPPQVATRVRANLFWLGNTELKTDDRLTFRLGTARTDAEIESIEKTLDAVSLHEVESAKSVKKNSAATCVLKLKSAIAFDTNDGPDELRRFVLIQNYRISGGGILLQGLSDPNDATRKQVHHRNYKWISGSVLPGERSERFGQKPQAYIVIGQDSSRRKKHARQLERELFDSGKQVYFLGMGSIVHGLSSDLNREARSENIRRLAEVANIVLDAGLIVVVTAKDLTDSDLDLMKTIMDRAPIEIVRTN